MHTFRHSKMQQNSLGFLEVLISFSRFAKVQYFEGGGGGTGGGEGGGEGGEGGGEGTAPLDLS